MLLQCVAIYSRRHSLWFLCIAALLLAVACGNDEPPPVRCGDGHIGEQELCDDGNLAVGDGCRPDCKGREPCGDALLDVGEVCDDGNAVNGDGCRAVSGEKVTAAGATVTRDGLDDASATC